jgi:hypothetical protein
LIKFSTENLQHIFIDSLFLKSLKDYFIIFQQYRKIYLILDDFDIEGEKFQIDNDFINFYIEAMNSYFLIFHILLHYLNNNEQLLEALISFQKMLNNTNFFLKNSNQEELILNLVYVYE